MRSLMLHLAIALSLLLAAGCTTYGTKQITSAEILSQIEPGKTTQEEVIALLGPPVEVVPIGEGEEIWKYGYTDAQMRPETFIPFVGWMVGGTDWNTHTLNVRLKHGVVSGIGKARQGGTSGVLLDLRGQDEKK